MKKLSRHFFAALLLVGSTSNYALTTTQPVDFNADTAGQYNTDEFKKDWLTGMYSSEKGNLYIANATDASNNVAKRNKKRRAATSDDKWFEVVYPKGQVGGSAGVAFPAPLQGDYDKLFFQYEVMFPADFSPPEKGGGKLPGLASDEDESGCVSNVSGFSSRYMWRYDTLDLKLYLYYPGKTENCGDYVELDTPYRFTPGQWTTLTQEVKLNTIGKKDGYIHVWVNGVPYLDLQNLELRTDANLHISYAQIDAFPGGSDTSQWAFTSDQRNYFDNFTVSLDKPALLD